MLDVLRFWLERGVDGFRVDALRQLVKDDELRDNPAEPRLSSGTRPHTRHSLRVYTADRPETLRMVARCAAWSIAIRTALLIGELYLPIERLVAYYGVDGDGVHLPSTST